MQLSFRPETEKDETFIREVYASTRAAELALVDWSDEEKSAFVDMQFNAQHQSFRGSYPEGEFLIILKDDQPVGRLYVDDAPDRIILIDIALLPVYCGMGIGSHILQDMQARAHKNNIPVTLHVETYNPALRLYERLGFQRTADIGAYYKMKWVPGREN